MGLTGRSAAKKARRAMEEQQKRMEAMMREMNKPRPSIVPMQKKSTVDLEDGDVAKELMFNRSKGRRRRGSNGLVQGR